MEQVSSETNVVIGNNNAPDYDAYLSRVNARFLTNIGSGPLFTTDADTLWNAYLGSMPEDQRQHHNCHACRQFIQRFGGLATIDEAGVASSPIWIADDAPEVYKPAITAMARLVRRAKVNGVFLSTVATWGTPVTGIWRHLSVRPPASLIYNKRALLTADQAMAEKREDFKNVMFALGEFTQPMIEQALSLLKTDSLYRGEKVIGPAQWLYDLHVAIAQHKARANVVWRAVATAPVGFCHPRSSMIGTLLEDISAGLEFSEVSRRFAAKMHPLQYQRPQAAPAAGNIAQAETLVEQMGIRESLRRRFAQVEEIETIWKPAVIAETKSAGIFGHLLPKSTQARAIGAPTITMTWEKFARTVLPDALEIEYYVPYSSSFAALLTAANMDAPPILQWDREDWRNPVSWYLYNGGSTARIWGLSAGAYCKVTAVTLKPSMWGDKPVDHQGNGVIFVLAGAKDSRKAGLALFPEMLKSELRAIRSTVEAFSAQGEIEGLNEASACGIALFSGSVWSARFRVHAKLGVTQYVLDRWD